MSWPLSQDYNEAVQNAQTSFADPELRGGQVVVNALGIPLPRSGNFADVYEFHGASGSQWAIKCFTRQIPGLRERYREISTYLKQVKLSFMVDFGFLDQGIRIRSAWYPILRMQWVEGLTLNEFVKRNLGWPQTLEMLCQRLVQVATLLRQAKLGHCDLQHGNVLLVAGHQPGAFSIRLVDYDGMCVPSLTLLKSIELGHPAYQHPQRLRERIYSPEVDRFSLLVIYTALRSLVVGGAPLWERYDTGDNLLFRREDFQAPGSSALIQELLRSRDPAIRLLVATLVSASQQPLDRTPLLTDLLAEQRPVPKSVQATPVQAQAVAMPPKPLLAPKDAPQGHDLAIPTATTGTPSFGQEYEHHSKPRWIPWVAAGCVVGLLGLLVALMSINTKDSAHGSRDKTSRDVTPARAKKLSQHQTGTIHLIIAPADAQVFLDDQAVELADRKEFSAPPGKHELRITKKDHQAYIQDLEVVAGRTQIVQVKLKVIEQNDEGTILLQIEPRGAAVFLDNRPIPPENQNEFLAPIGRHTLRISKQGFQDHVQQIHVAAQTTQRITIELKSTSDQTTPSVLQKKTTVLQEKTWTWGGSKDNYARCRNLDFEVGMGNNRGGFGCSDAGIEIENGRFVRVSLEYSAAFRRLDDNSYAGFMVDYHTKDGYTERVALSIGLHSTKRKVKNPVWGKLSMPDRFVELGKQAEYALDLQKWAPVAWDGKFWFTTTLQNTGTNTFMKGRIVVSDKENE